MTVSEKLHVMETVWAHLSRDEQQIESPEWHFEELAEREHRVAAGNETVLEWEAAEHVLRDRHP